MEQDYISRKEYEEHSKRMEDEHRRLHYRISDVEKTNDENHKLIVAVEKLAISMEGMKEELKDQGLRLYKLESQDGKKWSKAVETIITVVISAVLGFIFAQIGF